MNSKKAKQLRQLTRHLQNRDAVPGSETEWHTLKKGQYPMKTAPLKMVKTDESAKEGEQTLEDMRVNGIRISSGRIGIVEQRMLDPKCGKAVYKLMKKMDGTGRKP